MAVFGPGQEEGRAALPAGGPAPGPAQDAGGQDPAAGRLPGTAGSVIWALEHSQDFITVFVGVALILLAAVLLVSGIVDFTSQVSHSTDISAAISAAAPLLLDRVLLVLILVEIVHTVVLSLRAHRLVAQPFIVVGLVAVIRRILFVLSLSGQAKVSVSTSELALLIAMVVVFVAGLIAVSRFEGRDP